LKNDQKNRPHDPHIPSHKVTKRHKNRPLAKSALCGAKITINNEIAKKNRRKVLKNRNIYRFSFEIQNNYVILQRI